MDLGAASRTRTRPIVDGTIRDGGIPSKRKLEIQLSKLLPLREPDLLLEQYPVSPEAAAELLYMAGFEHDDIVGKNVLDLGTGSGRLAVGAAMLGARSVSGIDIDPAAIKIARENGVLTGVDVNWVLSGLEGVEGYFDTVVMNPPYGTRKDHADRDFLMKAFAVSNVIYSIHKTSTRRFLTRFVAEKGREVDVVRGLEMPIPHLFGFHAKKWKTINVDVYRITKSARIDTRRRVLDSGNRLAS